MRPRRFRTPLAKPRTPRGAAAVVLAVTSLLGMLLPGTGWAKVVPVQGAGIARSAGTLDTGVMFDATLTTRFTPGRVNANQGFSYEAELNVVLTDPDAEGCDQPADDHTDEPVDSYGFGLEPPDSTIYETTPQTTGSIPVTNGTLSRTTTYFECNKTRQVNSVRFDAPGGLPAGCWQTDVVESSIYMPGPKPTGGLATLTAGGPSGSCGYRLLTVTVRPPVAGPVVSDPAGIECPTTCSSLFAPNQTVELSDDSDGFWYPEWAGDCSGHGACSVTMDADKAVTATFSPYLRVFLKSANGGSGRVTGTPAGIGDGIDCVPFCQTPFPFGTTVVLTAHPQPNSVFQGWADDCSGSSLTCSVPMNQPRDVQATFAGLPITQSEPDTTGPLLVLAKAKILSVSKKGIFRFRLAAMPEDVTGDVLLRTARKVRVASASKRKVLTIGRKRFSARKGQKPVLRFKLNRAAKKAFRKAKRLRLKATVTLRDTAGNATVKSAVVTLKRARRRAR